MELTETNFLHSHEYRWSVKLSASRIGDHIQLQL